MKRQSNIELLRFISMFMIMVFHFNCHSFLPKPNFFSSEGILWNITHTLTISATSIFVLISGFFGIRFRIKGVLRLYLHCALWGIIGYVVYCACANTPPVEIAKLFARLAPFTHGKWWFIVTYLELYFLSPILNTAIEMFDRKKHMLSIFIFGFVTLYMGYCRETGEDVWGTSLSHFLWLYMIARYINKYISIKSIRSHRWGWFGGFLASSAIIFALAAIESKFTVPCCIRAYPYCSPWVLTAALSLLLFALSFDFDCQTINRLASSSLSGYLFQDHIYFGFGVLYPMITAWMMPMPLLERYALLPIISIIWLLGCCLCDNLLNIIVYRPILTLFDKISNKLCQNNFKDKFFD